MSEMKKLRTDYENIFKVKQIDQEKKCFSLILMNIPFQYLFHILKEIEGDESDVVVQWPSDCVSSVAYPKFVPKKTLNTAALLVKHNNNKQRDNKQPNTAVVNTQVGTNKDTQLAKIDSGDHVRQIVSSIDTETAAGTLEIGDLKLMSKSELVSLKENISLEMLWIQQAIQSRIQVRNILIIHTVHVLDLTIQNSNLLLF